MAAQTIYTESPDNHAVAIISQIHGSDDWIPYWIVEMNEGR
jgi:hypothetical protein